MTYKRNIFTFLLKLKFLKYSTKIQVLQRRHLSQCNVDLIVIGAGPAGYVASLKAAQSGMRTICIEKNKKIGGTYVNDGCVAAKFLLHNSYLYYLAKSGDLNCRGIKVDKLSLDLEKMMCLKDNTIEFFNSYLAKLFQNYEIPIINGHATIVSPTEVCAVDSCGEKTLIRTKKILIATGCDVQPFADIKIDNEKIISPNSITMLKSVPEKIIIIGAGPSGIEMGSIWSRFGSNVIFVENTSVICGGFMDSEISKTCHESLVEQGMKFMFNTKVVSAEKTDKNVRVCIENIKNSKERELLEADILLVNVGRLPNTANLGLENVCIETDKSGCIPVNEQYQTVCPSIYAIGDVIPGIKLAHRAEKEAYSCIGYMTGECHKVHYNFIPYAIGILPEIAAIGATEDYLKKKGISYKVGKYNYSVNARAQIQNELKGFVKVLADKKTDHIIGVHIIGADAKELIHEFVIGMQYGKTSESIARACHGHPSFGEAIEEACLIAHCGCCSVTQPLCANSPKKR